jgi:hypothetical protein
MLLGCIAQHAECGAEAIQQHLPFVAESLAHPSVRTAAAVIPSPKGLVVGDRCWLV